MMNEHYNVEEAIAAQEKYCKENDYPHFAPSDGRCYKCYGQIYGEKGWSVEQAASSLITGCPFCRYSYVE